MKTISRLRSGSACGDVNVVATLPPRGAVPALSFVVRKGQVSAVLLHVDTLGSVSQCEDSVAFSSYRCVLKKQFILNFVIIRKPFAQEDFTYEIPVCGSVFYSERLEFRDR